MVNWCCTVVDYLEFERETVVIALSCLDRFLETTTARDLQCLSSPRQFKIAGMTCLYTAIKAHEPEAIEPDLVVELSGNLCDVQDIEDMERTILAALHWHINPPTALAFVGQLLDNCPKCILRRKERDALQELAQVQTELAVTDPRLVATPPSLLALACIFNALESQSKNKNNDKYMELLDDLSQLFFVALSSSKNLNMDNVFDVQDIIDEIIRSHNEKTRMEQAAKEEEERRRATEEAGDEEYADEDTEVSTAISSASSDNDSKIAQDQESAKQQSHEHSSPTFEASPTSVVYNTSNNSAAEAA